MFEKRGNQTNDSWEGGQNGEELHSRGGHLGKKKVKGVSMGRANWGDQERKGKGLSCPKFGWGLKLEF